MIMFALNVFKFASGAFGAVLLGYGPALAQDAGTAPDKVFTAGASAPMAAESLDVQGVSPAVTRFYGKSERRAAWSPGQAQALTAALKAADGHAIDPHHLLVLIAQPGSRSAHDVALTRAALAYGQALSQGLSDPAQMFDIYTLTRNHVDVVAGLQGALKSNDVGGWLASLAPQDDDYKALSGAYLLAVKQVADPAAPPIPSGDAIRLGQSDPRVSQIAAKLQAEGFEAATAVPTPATPPAAPLAAQTAPPADPGAAPAPSPPVTPSLDSWTPALASALSAYQRAHGLMADGVVGDNTLASLNETPADRARRLAVNLEQRRWTTRDPSATRIDVNTAASTLSYVRSGQAVWTTRVAPGRPSWATPMLQASFDRLVVNPPWNVPADIARKEIDTKGHGYLSSHHMRRIGGRIVQSPGPWAALGRVKFDMLDRYAIYLHDTPEKSAFARSQRHLSHGCVRVEGAVDFARRLATQSSKGDAFDRVLASGHTGVVTLDQPVPVRLLYLTASVDAAGQVSLSPDVYGWDAKVAKALGMAPTSKGDVPPPAAATLGP